VRGPGFKPQYHKKKFKNERKNVDNLDFYLYVYLFTYLFFAVLGLELRAYTLRHSTSPIFVKVFFKIGSHELFPPSLLLTLILLNSAS
jgi:hypothetical protein